LFAEVNGLRAVDQADHVRLGAACVGLRDAYVSLLEYENGRDDVRRIDGNGRP
jgi:hypothetical protein